MAAPKLIAVDVGRDAKFGPKPFGKGRNNKAFEPIKFAKCERGARAFEIPIKPWHEVIEIHHQPLDWVADMWRFGDWRVHDFDAPPRMHARDLAQKPDLGAPMAFVYTGGDQQFRPTRRTFEAMQRWNEEQAWEDFKEPYRAKIKWWREFLSEHGKYLGSGATREAYLFRGVVVKVPNYATNIDHNRTEAHRYAVYKSGVTIGGKYGAIPAKCFMVDDCVLIMEYVVSGCRYRTETPRTDEALKAMEGDDSPAWVDYVDAQQCGLNSLGDVVSFDCSAWQKHGLNAYGLPVFCWQFHTVPQSSSSDWSYEESSDSPENFDTTF